MNPALDEVRVLFCRPILAAAKISKWCTFDIVAIDCALANVKFSRDNIVANIFNAAEGDTLRARRAVAASAAIVAT